MRAEELIGKYAVRSKPVYKDVVTRDKVLGASDVVRVPLYDYCTEPVKIINATDTHLVIETSVIGDVRTEVLDFRFADDGWVDYEKLMGDHYVDPFEKERLDFMSKAEKRSKKNEESLFRLDGLLPRE